MTGAEIGLTAVASVLGLIATALTILTFFKNQSKDKASETKEATADIVAVKTDIIYIKDGIGELKRMIQAQTDKQHDLELKVQKIEDKVTDVDVRLLAIEKRRLAAAKKGATK